MPDAIDTPALPPALPPAPAAAPAPPPGVAPDWQPLPLRAASIAAVGGAIGGTLLLGGVCAAAWIVLDLPLRWYGAAGMLVLGGLAGAGFGFRRQRRTFWRLDEAGLAMRRDLMWQLETRVPLSRVQHLDLRRGPIERGARLATLVVHTAGSRFSAVTLSGLDAADAEHLRDTLAHQLDQDDDAL